MGWRVERVVGAGIKLLGEGACKLLDLGRCEPFLTVDDSRRRQLCERPQDSTRQAGPAGTAPAPSLVPM